jgi:hypothetical protein
MSSIKLYVRSDRPATVVAASQAIAASTKKKVEDFTGY